MEAYTQTDGADRVCDSVHSRSEGLCFTASSSCRSEASVAQDGCGMPGLFCATSWGRSLRTSLGVYHGIRGARLEGSMLQNQAQAPPVLPARRQRWQGTDAHGRHLPAFESPELIRAERLNILVPRPGRRQPSAAAALCGGAAASVAARCRRRAEGSDSEAGEHSGMSTRLISRPKPVS